MGLGLGSVRLAKRDAGHQCFCCCRARFRNYSRCHNSSSNSSSPASSQSSAATARANFFTHASTTSPSSSSSPIGSPTTAATAATNASSSAQFPPASWCGTTTETVRPSGTGRRPDDDPSAAGAGPDDSRRASYAPLLSQNTPRTVLSPFQIQRTPTTSFPNRHKWENGAETQWVSEGEFTFCSGYLCR